MGSKIQRPVFSKQPKATSGQITNIGNQITNKQNQVYQLQTTLTNQMAAADALIASMEQQYSYLSNMFQAQQTAAQMYK
jgi:hypothetical protein